MIKSEKLGFLFLVLLQIIFFIFPEIIQKPFRILLGLFFFIVFFVLYVKRKLPLWTIVPIFLLIVIIIILFYQGTLQSSFINSFLCFTAFFYIDKLKFHLNSFRERILDWLFYLMCFSLILQFFIFEYEGRPCLSYEINLSGAYLFLFFLYSDALGKKFGKILVIVLSFFILSRLLIYSIILFYIVRYSKGLFLKVKLNFVLIYIFVYILFSVFTIWYALNFQPKIIYQQNTSRITNLNDGSNLVRFTIDAKVIASIINKDKNLLWGYGDIHKNKEFRKSFIFMPHNELFDFLVEFGVFALIAFACITLPIFSRYFEYNSYEYFFSLLFYTLLLWVRYFIIPSFESIFIFLILFLYSYRIKLKLVKC